MNYERANRVRAGLGLPPIGWLYPTPELHNGAEQAKSPSQNVATLKDKTVWPEPPRYPVQATGYTVTASSYPQLLSRIAEHCKGNAVETPSEADVQQWLCDNLRVKCLDDDGKLYANQYVDRSNWPLILRPMRLLAQPGDKGLGDIVARTIPKGEDLKVWFKEHGFNCGCTNRQNWLNVQYPI